MLYRDNVRWSLYSSNLGNTIDYIGICTVLTFPGIIHAHRTLAEVASPLFTFLELALGVSNQGTIRILWDRTLSRPPLMDSRLKDDGTPQLFVGILPTTIPISNNFTNEIVITKTAGIIS